MKFCALFYLSPFLPFSLRIHYISYFDDAKFSEKSHRNIRVPWLIIGIRSERKKCGSLKICRLFLGCTDYRMSNERYVMYFWEGFKMHTLFCAPLSAGFHRPIGVGWSLERQHLSWRPSSVSPTFTPLVSTPFTRSTARKLFQGPRRSHCRSKNHRNPNFLSSSFLLWLIER